jgi:flagellar protein FlbT
MLADTSAAFGPGAVADGLRGAAALVEAGRAFEALKAIRSLYALEAGLLPDKPRTPAAA